MEKFKSILNQYFWLIVLVWLIVIAAFVFWLGGVLETERFGQTVSNQRIEANKAVREAANANNAAVNASIERRTEDALREQIITPKLRDARRKSNDSKLALDQARKTYHEKKTDTANLSHSDADNCLRLKRLFPDIAFADCQ